MKKRNSKGFTLLELIIAIVILGILAVFVAPRFLNLQDDAREAKIAETFGAFESALKYAHSKWQINGGGSAGMNNMPGYGPTDNNGNYMLDMNDVGYPLGINKGEPMGQPHNIGQGDQGCYELFTAIVNTDYTFSSDAAKSDSVDFITKRRNLTFQDANGVGRTKLALCYFIYTKQGYNSNPDNAEIVYWYNSRNGSVTTFEPN